MNSTKTSWLFLPLNCITASLFCLLTTILKPIALLGLPQPCRTWHSGLQRFQNLALSLCIYIPQYINVTATTTTTMTDPLSHCFVLWHKATRLTRVDVKIFQRHWAGYLPNVLQNLLVQSCREAAHALGLSLRCEKICRKQHNHSIGETEITHKNSK